MRRVLIITYYWPPSGGSGVQRWLKMSKYFPEFGWQPVIYTAKDAEYPVEDASLEIDVTSLAEVIRRPIVEPYSFYKKFLGKKKDDKIKAGFIDENNGKKSWKEKLSVWIRGNFFIPDARCWWIKPSARFLLKYLKEHPVDAIISTGPPHSMHLIAMKLHQKANIPWIADFRDPWTDIDFYKDLMLTRCSDRKHHRLENMVLTSANEIVTVGRYCAENLERLGAKDVKVITNGYDFDLEDLTEETKLTDSFTISHIGIIGQNRNPEKLWEAIKELTVEHEDFKKSLEIRLIGQVDRSVVELIKANGLEQNVNYIKYILHNEVVIKQKESQVLLLLVNNTPNAKGVLTGKIFEYMASGRPILAIGPEDGDAANIIRETQSGVTVDFTDKNKMKAEILNAFILYRSHKLYINNTMFLQKYSRKELAKSYISILNQYSL